MDNDQKRFLSPARVSLSLGLASIFLLAIIILIMTGVISSLLLLKISLLSMLPIVIAGFLTGAFTRFRNRKKPPETWGRNQAVNGTQLTLISGIVFIIILIAIPGNRTIVSLHHGATCEEKLKNLGNAVETYLNDNKTLPETLHDLFKKGYIKSVPTYQYDKEFVYRIENATSTPYFIIECPDTDNMLKSRGLLSPRPYLELKYIQNKGLVVKTPKD